MQGGNGRNYAPPPPGRSPSSSSVSPSSSSSTHVGLETLQHQQQLLQQQQQQQQQLGLRQSLQHLQFKKPEGEKVLQYHPSGAHGFVMGNNFLPSSSGLSKKPGDLPQHPGVPQVHAEKQNEGQGQETNPRNTLHQAYLQYAFHAAQQKSIGTNQAQQQGKMVIVSPSGREFGARTANAKMQDIISPQATTQALPSLVKKSTEQVSHADKQVGCTGTEQKNDLKPPQALVGLFAPGNPTRPVQSMQSQASVPTIPNKQFAMAQLQALHAWASERGFDMSNPASANLIAQLLPAWQSRLSETQNSDESNMAVHQAKQQVISTSAVNENLVHGNVMSNPPGHGGLLKSRQTIHTGVVSTPGSSNAPITDNTQMQQQYIAQNIRDNQNDRIARNPISVGNGVLTVHPSQYSGGMNCSAEQTNIRSPSTGLETVQMQQFKELQQLERPAPQPGASSSTEEANNQFSAQSEHVKMPHQRTGFTKQQLHVLKAQILAFRRLRNMLQSGQVAMPEEILRAIIPPPLESSTIQHPAKPGMVQHDRNHIGKSGQVMRPLEIDNSPNATHSKVQNFPKEEPTFCKETTNVTPLLGTTSPSVENARAASFEKVDQNSSSVKAEKEVEHVHHQTSGKCDLETSKEVDRPRSSSVETGQTKKSVATNNAPTKDSGSTRKYYGPIFDFPFFMRKHDSFGSTSSVNYTNLVLAYDVNDLLSEEGTEVLIKKREENLRKIGCLLATNLERKRIRPDLILRLQIEERKLRLLDHQARLRDEVDQQQQEIMAMPDRPYRKFVKQCERQRIELVRQIQLSQKVLREKQLKSIFQWRKKLLETHWAIRDARTTRNRGVAKYHERMLREFSKRNDDDRNKRMEALKNNDVDRYREMLLEQQTNISGDAAQRYSVLSSFLTQTEEYLHKLGGKITAAKNYQEVEDAARAAAAAARAQGLSEEEIKAAAACAGEEVMIRNRFSEMNAPKDSLSINKYYNLAHAVNEKIVQQPSMLRTGTLRDYQIVGLQWMLSLYNNKLNGILADEMGLGKTVQVMALIAYLMEFKGNYGPHLIIVPNAVLVNWKSELYNWLPSVSCLFYVGGKEQRSKLFSQEVCAIKFNILVTTYEFVMYDRSKLSKIDWKYIIIDEAQRMKDRESVLARDLDRYRCQRRLLLTGTPLQNDLKELWSLLNLLLPEVFDNRKAFHDWFSKPFQKDGPSNPEEDDWLETEKKVIIIHRLHQILEPFMLRRRVEDVEGSLPRKVSIVLRCRMSAMQGAIYDWIKATGTIRVDPEDELRRTQKNPLYQAKMYKNLNNKCMELRKACNHPLLNYPFYSDYSKDFLVRSCGKLWILDRILIKLQRAGHRVLLFSTMTKLLDILEEYLQWRHLAYRRIDGSTSLEDRESAIVDFNSPEGECFIFLLSIRAAGRGLNLQTADTVVIYDPDPNPQNEEQAVARAHRIGQLREVKVIYMEAVVDKISSYQKEDELRSGGMVDFEDDLAGKDRYIGSIESLIRNNIQQYKIDMADEVINAGRFDQRTTHEERRMTLETLLHDEERYQETVHDVPSLQEVNRMIARSEEEVELFDQMDEEFGWTGDMMKYYQVPKWLRAGSGEISALVASLSKKPSKNIFTGSIDLEPREASPNKPERRRGRPRGSTDKRFIYAELDDEDGEDSEASSEDRIAYSLQEEGEIGEDEDEDLNAVAGMSTINKNHSEEDEQIGDGDASEFYQPSDGNRYNFFEEADSGSSESLQLNNLATPSIWQKFGSLSALDSKPNNIPNRPPEELEEGEIALSGDSHVEFQQSQSSIHDRDDGEDEHVVQPKLKRKRSNRFRPRYILEKSDETSRSERAVPLHGSQLPLPMDHDFDPGVEAFNTPLSNRQEGKSSSLKSKSNLPSRKVKSGTPNMLSVVKPNRSNCFSGSADDATEHSGGSLSSKAPRVSGYNFVNTKAPEVMQRKCKNVISKLQKRVAKDGHQIVPAISGFWKSPSAATSKVLLDPRKISQCVDSCKYGGISDFIDDVQLMLRNLVQYFGGTFEVNSEARKLNGIFFDVMKTVFPDMDFRAERNLVTFSVPGGPAPIQSPKQSGFISKNHKLNSDMESESGSTRNNRRGQGAAEEDIRPPGHTSKYSKESAVSACTPSFPAHPGDLVFSKGKRKDRDKPAVMQRMGPASPSNPNSRVLASPPSLGRAGPVSPTSHTSQSRMGSAASTSTGRSSRVPFQKDQHQSQQGMHNVGWARQRPQQVDGVGSIVEDEAQWAKPVKKMRTDTGKRRPPCHL